jgi:Ca-activated chloride channel family protein
LNFLAPLAFAFAASIPVVIVFYLLKRKRVVKLVSSTLLWQKFLADTQASAPFQKLRKNWLLYLQILLLALAVLALTRPFFATEAKPAQLRVVILDGSASMQATDESPSRFEKARAEALKWVDSLEPTDQMVVLLAGANTEVKQSATSEKAALRRALGDLTEFENKALPLIYHKVGRRADNLGITALDARANPEDAAQRAIYASVANFSSNTLSADLELYFQAGGASSRSLLETRPLTIPGQQAAPQVFKALQERDGVFSVRLTSKDDLAADNEASIVSWLPKPVNVLLVTRGNRLLEKALRAVAGVQLAVANDLTDAAAGFDFVVLDGVQPSDWPKGNVLAFRTVNTNWIGSVALVEGPVIVDWKPTHPLLRYAGFDNVQIVQSLTPDQSLGTPPWATAILEAPQAPLILAGELGRQRIVWVGFDPLESNWPLRVSFPIFIANAVDWLNPANAKNSQLLIKAGDPFRLALAEPVKTAEVTSPDGRTTVLNVEGASEIIFGDTARRGVYHLRAGTNEVAFAANLLDAAESNILPRDELKLGEYTRVAATTVQRTNMELWRTLAAIGLAVLLLEWWWYHRRTV